MHVSGTPLNDELYQFIDKRNSFEMKLEDIDRKEARMIMDGEAVEEIQTQLNLESEHVFQELNDYIKSFITNNYDNVLGANVFMMLCNTLPYPIMTPQIEDILENAPNTFKSNSLVKEFITTASQNMELIDEYQRMVADTSN